MHSAMPHNAVLDPHVTYPTPGDDPPATEPAIVLVPLRGKHGEGRAFVLDAADWQVVRETWAGLWSLLSNGSGRHYVVGRYPPAGSGGDTAVLARWMLGARRGQVVLYLDGDPLNLRRSNLLLMDARDVERWRMERGAATQ